MTLLTKPVVRETLSTIRGRNLVVTLEPQAGRAPWSQPSVLVRLKGEGPQGERYRFTIEELFLAGARRELAKEGRRRRRV